MKIFTFSVIFVASFIIKSAQGCLVIGGKSTTPETTTPQMTSEATTTFTSTTSDISDTTQESTTPYSDGTTQSTGSESTITEESTTGYSTTKMTTEFSESTSNSPETTQSASSESTVSMTSTEATSQSFSETTGSSTLSSSLSTTTADCIQLCDNADNVLINDKVVFKKPEYSKLSNGGSSNCGKYNVVCKADEGQICDRIQMFATVEKNMWLMELGNESPLSVEAKIECSGDGKYYYIDEDGVWKSTFSDLFCQYTNCHEYTTTTSLSPSTTAGVSPSTTASVSPSTTASVSPSTTASVSCSSCDITSLFNYEDPTDKFQPWYYDIVSENCECKAYEISCELYGVDQCDYFEIAGIAEDGSEMNLAESRTNKVSGQISCHDNGKFVVNEENIKEVYCTYSNCRNSTEVLETTATTIEPTTTIPKSCKTCDVPSLFNYGDENYFQPWYQDIDGGNCDCKFTEISCEMFGNLTCESFKIAYNTIDGVSGTLADSSTKKVVGQIDCQQNGLYAIDGKSLAQIYCIQTNCS